MKIINQTKNNSCVACVLAMIVSESEQYVLDWFNYIDPPFYDEDAFIFLAHHGMYLSLCGNLKNKNNKGIDIHKYQDIKITVNMKIHQAYLVVDSHTIKGQTHAVFWNCKNVLDPQYKKPQPLENYKVRYIYPLLTTNKRMGE